MTTGSADQGHTAEVDQSQELVPRKAEALVAEALADTRVVTLNGARDDALALKDGRVARRLADRGRSRGADLAALEWFHVEHGGQYVR